MNNETPLVLLDDWGYQLLNYYGIEIRPYWRRIQSPRDTVDVPGYLPYLQKRLSRARKVYYLREDDSQNCLDPNDVALKSLRILGEDEIHIPYNRRFQLFGWTLKKDDIPRQDTLNAATGKPK